MGDGGIIMAPNQVSLLCSFDADSGTIFSGCKNGGTGNDGFFGPNATDEMMRSHMDGGAVGYNEVILDSAQFRANMPKSIAAIEYGLKLGNAAAESGLRTSFDKVRAVNTYVMLLDRYNLTEKEIPLLRANFDTEDVTGVNGQHGVALVDESEGAREYLANHPYAPPLRSGARATRTCETTLSGRISGCVGGTRWRLAMLFGAGFPLQSRLPQMRAGGKAAVHSTIYRVRETYIYMHTSEVDSFCCNVLVEECIHVWLGDDISKHHDWEALVGPSEDESEVLLKNATATH